jgi:hypothetical protein
MTKGQLIDEIRAVNPTAQTDFLQQFEEPELQEYVRRLAELKNGVIRISGWRPVGQSSDALLTRRRAG